jgi:uncharacterized protein
MTDENITPESTPETLPEGSPEITSDDKLWGALSYFALIAIIMLLMEEKKKRPFIRFHAVQALALSVGLAILTFILGLIPVVGWCIAPFLWLILLWPAIGAFGGKYTEIPIITNFIKNQGWVGSA